MMTWLMCCLLATGDVGDTAAAGRRAVAAKAKAKGRMAKGVRATAERQKAVSERIVEAEVRPPADFRIRPAENDDADESALTELQRGVLDELQAALDGEDLKGVRKSLARFTASPAKGGLGGSVPKCMRSSAVAALGWFGKDAAVDLIEYVADADEEVSDEAFDALEQAMQDSEMTDRERAEMLVSIMQGLNDADRIDSLLFSLNELPNSLKAEVVAAIMDKGTAQAKATMAEQIGFYLDDEVVTADDIRRWAAENPDDD